jgi:hypothetical protein
MHAEKAVNHSLATKVWVLEKKNRELDVSADGGLVKLTPKKTEMITHDANTDDFSSDEHSDEDVKQFVSGYDE